MNHVGAIATVHKYLTDSADTFAGTTGADVVFGRVGTSAILQVDSNLTAAGVTWVNVATFDNQSAATLNASEAIIFGQGGGKWQNGGRAMCPALFFLKTAGFNCF